METKVRTISYLNEEKEFDIRLKSGPSVCMVQDPSGIGADTMGTKFQTMDAGSRVKPSETDGRSMCPCGHTTLTIIIPVLISITVKTRVSCCLLFRILIILIWTSKDAQISLLDGCKRQSIISVLDHHNVPWKISLMALYLINSDYWYWNIPLSRGLQNHR